MIFSNIVGRFLKLKGLHIYIQAISEINKENLSFELVGNFGEDEKYNNYIRSILDKKIKLRGFIKDIRNYYEQIDVVVLTSIEPDSLPTVLIEGLAKGKILIGTDVGGVKEIIDESYGNIIIPPNHIESLKESILKIGSYDKEKIHLIKERNIQRAKELFSLNKQIDSIEKVYYEVLK